jgi:hypothetical protein
MGFAVLTYLLDANVISYFLHCRREVDLMAAGARCPLAIADEVRVELLKSRTHGERFKKWFAARGIDNLEILVGSDVDSMFQSLPVSNSARGRGERASIALAAHDASRVLVANDRNAMWLALDELHLPGERIIGVPVFLRRLREQAALTVEAIDGVMGMRQGRRPTWWATWRASLTSP